MITRTGVILPAQKSNYCGQCRAARGDLLGFSTKREPETGGKQHVILLIAKYGLAVVSIVEEKIASHPAIQLGCDTEIAGDPVVARIVQ